jgi:hypothetical protein
MAQQLPVPHGDDRNGAVDYRPLGWTGGGCSMTADYGKRVAVGDAEETHCGNDRVVVDGASRPGGISRCPSRTGRAGRRGGRDGMLAV